MMFCLDDGAELLYGPASAEEPATAILHSTAAPGEAPTRAQINTTDQTAILPTGTGEIIPKPRGLDKRLLAKDQAFAWLEKDFQARTSTLPTWLATSPLDSLQDEPGYIETLRDGSVPCDKCGPQIAYETMP
jgi:hypothetical protein